jgi:16S rRNA (cytosine967-C5)-methyltransferase
MSDATPLPRRLNARSLALYVLLECRLKEAYAQELLDKALQHGKLQPADRRLCTQLVYGVLRRRGTLDALFRPFVNRQPYQVQPWLWEALRLGTYQILLLTNIPAHAALYETVELANDWGQPNAKGFLNGVLRKVLPLLGAGMATAAADDALPFADGEYRQLTQPVLPDPTKDPVKYLADGFAWPDWLAQRWLPRFGWDECVRLGFWFAGPAHLWLRSNPLRSDRAGLLERLHEAGISAEAGEHPQAVRLGDFANVRELPGFAEGHFVVQDGSAMQLASALNPQPGWRVLDLCSAPGGKTTHLAELMQNQGEIVACDIDAKRLKQVEDSCQRLGITIVRTQALRHDEPAPDLEFDAALVDVPCSNTGVLGKRPEVRWRLQPKDLQELVPLQTRLLQRACERVKPGGVIVYSTCSIEPEENRQVVDAMLKREPSLTREAEQENVPGRPADGGYWARLRKQP